MNTISATAGHPTNQDLAAFALGKPTSQSAETIANHLEKCPQCERVLSETPRDTLLGILKSAKPGSSLTGAYRPPEPNATLSGSIAAAPVDPDELPEDLKNQTKYKFLKKLGSGGMGMVYLAEHVMMQRKVAIKLLPPSLADKPDVVARFINEIVSAAKLEHHNVVRAYSTERVGKHILLEMEYVDGLDLGAVVEKKGPLPITNAIAYIRMAATGLQQAHLLKMVHRDIKPRNLMLTRGGAVKIADFGLAKFAQQSSGMTSVNAVMGTPDYMAPEQAKNAKDVDIRADIYSLGCTFYFLLTGQPPFGGTTAIEQIFAHIEQPVPDVAQVRTDTPPLLAEFIAKMMAKKVDDRPPTPKEVIDGLNRIEKELAKKEKVDEPSNAMMRDLNPDKQSKKSGPGKWIGIGVASVGLLIGCLAAVGAFKKSETTVISSDGSLVILVNEPGATVAIDGKKVIPEWNPERTRGEIKLASGRHKIDISKLGFVPDSGAVELGVRDTRNYVVSLRSLPLPEPKNAVAPAISNSTQIAIPAEATLAKPIENVSTESRVMDRTAEVNGTGWKVVGQELVLLYGCQNKLKFGSKEWKNYTLQCDVMVGPSNSLTRGFGTITLGGRDTEPKADKEFGYHFTLSFDGSDEKTSLFLGATVPGTLETAKRKLFSNRWYNIKIRFEDASIKCYIDDELVFSKVDDKHTRGNANLFGSWVNARFKNISITDLSGEVHWKGVPELKESLAINPTTATPKLSESELIAKELLERTRKVYAKCKTYRDTGVVKTTYFRADAKLDFTVLKPFSTAFVRPNQFRFEYSDNNRNSNGRTYTFWQDGDSVQRWDVTSGIKKLDCLVEGIVVSVGSGGSSSTVPFLLISDEIQIDSIGFRSEMKTIGDSAYRGINCFRVEGKSGTSPRTIWIDKKDYLIRRIDEQYQGPTSRTETMTTYDPVIDGVIPAALLKFNPPKK